MKIPIFPGKYHQNGGFFMAMLVYRRVHQLMCTTYPQHLPIPRYRRLDGIMQTMTQVRQAPVATPFLKAVGRMDLGTEWMYIWVFPKIGVGPKSWILIGFSIINHPFWGTLIFGNTHIHDFSLDGGNQLIVQHDQQKRFFFDTFWRSNNCGEWSGLCWPRAQPPNQLIICSLVK